MEVADNILHPTSAARLVSRSLSQQSAAAVVELVETDLACASSFHGPKQPVVADPAVHGWLYRIITSHTSRIVCDSYNVILVLLYSMLYMNAPTHVTPQLPHIWLHLRPRNVIGVWGGAVTQWALTLAACLCSSC